MSKSKIKKASKPVARPVQNRALDEPQRPDPTKRRPGVFSRSILPALAFCILHFAFCIGAQATITVTGLVNQVTAFALDTKITFTPARDILTLTNGLSAGPALTITSSNGAFSTPLNPGTYLVRLPLIGGRNAFTIGVPHGTSSENITNLIAAPWTYQDFLNTMAGGSATNIYLQVSGGLLTITTNAQGNWTVDLTTNTIASIAGSGGGSGTFSAGQNTTWRTSGGSNVVDVTGTLTNNTTGNATTATTATTASSASIASLANAGDSATGFFPAGTIEDARLPLALTNKTLYLPTADFTFLRSFDGAYSLKLNADPTGSWEIAGGLSLTTGSYTGNASGLSIGSPALGTNSGTATDGMILTKTGDRLAWVAAEGGGDMIAANNLADVASSSQSRTNLNAHRAENLTRGTVDPARLPSVPASQTTNFAATVATLNALGATGMGARNIKGRDALHLWTAVHSNKPVRLLILGDSVTDYVETTRGIRRAFNGYMSAAGWGTYYTERSDGGNDVSLHHYASYATTADTAYTPGTIFKMTNGAVITSVAAAGGVTADALQVYFHGGAALGSILVETQRNGGTWGTRATITASALPNEYRATNFALTPLTNYNVRFTSTGSNNLANWGLLNTTATTNTHAWAKMANAGNTIANLVTNAGFWTFLTNYAPQIIFVEAKDPVADLAIADAWMKANLTNYDVVWIANAPNLPDSGAADSREYILASAQTNNAYMVFDKYSYFTPTNFFYSSLPWAAENIWADGAHLGAKGIAYISSAFANWFGVGSGRFAYAGLLPMGTGGTNSSDATKANLAGGNNFSGTQVFTNQVALAAGSELGLMDPAGSLEFIRVGRTNYLDLLRVRWSAVAEKSMFVITNGLATTNLYMDTDPGYLMTLGANSPFKFKGIGEFTDFTSPTGTVAGTLYVGAAVGNGVGFTNVPITALWGSGGTNTPATNGTAGQVLLSAANGGVYWGTAGAGDVTTAQLTSATNNLDGSKVTVGTVADARIASTITRDTEWDTIGEIEAIILRTFVTNNATLTSGRVQVGDGGRGVANATASGAVSINADGTATTFAQIQTLAPSVLVTNGATTAVSLAGVTADGYAARTNLFTVNSAIGMGTNYDISLGAVTGGITGIIGTAGTAKQYAELCVISTGATVFTNPVAFYASDGLDSRTLTNGNLTTISIIWKPGVYTNLVFSWSK